MKKKMTAAICALAMLALTACGASVTEITLPESIELAPGESQQAVEDGHLVLALDEGERVAVTRVLKAGLRDVTALLPHACLQVSTCDESQYWYQRMTTTILQVRHGPAGLRREEST